MAKGSQPEDVVKDDLELQLDMMTLRCFENPGDEEHTDEDEDDMKDKLFIKFCYGRGKSLRDVIVPRIPQKYAEEVKESEVSAPYGPPRFEQKSYMVASVTAPEAKKRTGLGRARLLQDQVETSGLRQTENVHKPGGWQSSADQPLPASFTERRSECVIIDQNIDFSSLSASSSGRSSRSSADKYDVECQIDFPNLSSATEGDPCQRKNKGKGRSRKVLSLKKLSKQTATSELFHESGVGDSGDNIRGRGVGQDDEYPSLSGTPSHSCPHSDRGRELNFDDDDIDDVGSIFDDVSVEDSDGMFTAVRRKGDGASSKDKNSAPLSRTEGSHRSDVTGMTSDTAGRDTAKCFDVSEEQDSIDNADIKTTSQDNAQSVSDPSYGQTPTREPANGRSEDGKDHSGHNSAVDGPVQSNSHSKANTKKSHTNGSDPETNGTSGSDQDNGTASDSSGRQVPAGAIVAAAAAKKPKVKKVWKLEGTDVIQFDNVPKGGEKQLGSLISHYAKVIEKEKKARSGGKYSVRFRLQALDDSDGLDLEWIVECFQGDEGIFPGNTLSCHRLKDGEEEDGTTV